MNPAPRQHTPGPWYLNPQGWVVQSTGDIVTRLECSNNKEGDALLIASAPDLLAALVDMTDRYARAMKDSGVSHYPEAMVEIRSARAAIAKATGGAA